MSTIDLGKIFITWAGDWIPRKNYEVLTGVRHNSAFWISLLDNTGVEPGTSENVWAMVTEDGKTPEISIDNAGNIYSDGKLVSSVLADQIGSLRTIKKDLEDAIAIGDEGFVSMADAYIQIDDSSIPNLNN